MLNKNQTFKLILIPVIILLLYIGGRFFVFYQLEKIIRKELGDLEKQGIQIKFEALNVGPWKNEIAIKGMEIKFTEDYAADTKVGAKATTIQIRGINLFKILTNKELAVRSIYLSEPHIQTSKTNAQKQPQKKVNSNTNSRIHRFYIHRLAMDEGRWIINDNSKTPVRITSLGKVELKDFKIINRQDKPLEWMVGKTSISAVKLDFTKDYYTLKVKEIDYDSNKKLLNIDSIQVIPHYDKTTFAKKAGKEVSRLVATIPRLTATDCELTSAPAFKLSAHSMELNLWLESFRDKRYPFKNPLRDLPVKMLQEMPIVLNIDTINVINSYVEHQEIAKKGAEIGRVFFSKINVQLQNVNNRPKDENTPPMTMHATAQFMNTGDLDAHFTFPAKANGTYTANGKLSNFPLPTLNAILEPTANAKIESGDMNWIKFQFDYNNTRSDGKVEISYNDLKVTLFQKDDKEKKASLKNFIINTFFLKKNMDDQLAKAERTGTILYYRDQHRAIFHYWWQSVFTGFLSAIDIKLPDKSKENNQ